MSGARTDPGAPLPSLPPRADTAAPRAYHQMERAQPRLEPRQSSTAWKKRRWRWMAVLLVAGVAAAGVALAIRGDGSPPTDKPAESTIPAQFQDALRDARGFLDVTPFSRSGLIRQLKFEQYSTDAAEWAVDNLGVNWRDQAARAATDFLEFDDLGEDGLREKLGFEGFTPDEIDDAVRQMKVQGLL